MAKIISIAPVLVDTGIIYALADRSDAWHLRARSFVENYKGTLIIPSTVIPEACYLLQTHLSPQAEIAFVKSIVTGALRLEQVTEEDMGRALDVMNSYQDMVIGLVDASVVAVADRLNLSSILTTDRRHFSVVQPKHCPAFTLLPE
ncbi:MAG: type II toxin-antitoxin system VapC family toxin [Desulfuromonadaceae bacterium]